MILPVVRFLLRLELNRLGLRTVGPFDRELSGRIDRLVVALEALGGQP